MENQKDKKEQEYVTKEEAKKLYDLFKKYLKFYKEKDAAMSDQEWLEKLFREEFPDMDEAEAKQKAAEIVEAIPAYEKQLSSVREAAQQGKSKERWLAEKLEEAPTGIALAEYGCRLQEINDVLAYKNQELAGALVRAADGNIKMSPNLDGNIAEHMIADSAELSGFLQGKNIKVEVRDAFTKNSVDVRALNMDTGEWQNYQLKFGKDAKATIDLIERGNYNNQRIVVPSEQVEEVRAHFAAKGSSKTITDHIDAWGAKSKSYTKQDMKEIRNKLQQNGTMPQVDYNQFQIKDLALNIGKNAVTLGLQAAAITTGLNIAYQLATEGTIDKDELVEKAITTGADASIKTVTAATLATAVNKGIIRFLPKPLPGATAANLACVIVESVKVLVRVNKGELTLTEGLNEIGRISAAMLGGMAGTVKGFVIGVGVTAWIPVIGIPLGIVTGLVGGMIGYAAGSKIGEIVYETGKKVAKAAKTVAKAVLEGAKEVGRTIVGGIKDFFGIFA